MITIPTKSDSTLPTFANPGDAGADLVAISILEDDDNQITYGTGIRLAIPPGYVGLVFPRSSISKHNLSMANSVGVIDSGYRGEILLKFNKLNTDKPIYKTGDRIAQLVIVQIPTVQFELSNILDKTERGDNGFGSTGN